MFPSVLQDGRAYPAQGKSAAGPTSREVRSISNGDEYESQEFYPRELRAPAPPGHRGAAATSSSSSSLSSSASPRGLQLKIPAFGRELYLSLTRDSRFLSGSFAVHSRRSRHHTSVRSYRAEHACYYSGFVHNSRGSLASFSTCGGLVSAQLSNTTDTHSPAAVSTCNSDTFGAIFQFRNNAILIISSNTSASPWRGCNPGQSFFLSWDKFI